MLPMIPFELMPQTDEGEVSINVDLPVGTRIERTDAVMQRLEEMTLQAVPEAETIIASAGGGGFRSASYHRGRLEVRLVPKTERTRTSDEIAQDLRRKLSGLPGAIVRARASGSHNIMTRMFSGGMDQSANPSL